MRARIVFNRPLSAAYRHLGIAAPGFSAAWAPGQFVMVRPPDTADPLLPRAFSLYRVDSSSGGPAPVVEILYKVLGKGTQYLSRMEPGRTVEILGPLGNAFSVSPEVQTAVLVAGGIGVPPIAALARQIRNPQSAIRDCDVFLGGKTSDDILCLDDFETAGATIHVTTEDGSRGTRGLITDLLVPFLEKHGDLASRRFAHVGHPTPSHPHTPTPLCLFTCGPPGMLAAVARLAEGLGLSCQTSVEANMACGFGACMGCAVEARSSEPGPHFKLVCKDGPVFDSRELVW